MKKLLLYVMGLFLLIASALALTVPTSVEFDQTNAGETTSAKAFTINSDAALSATISSTATAYNVVFSDDDVDYSSILTTDLAIGDNTIYVKADIPDTEESGIKTIGNIEINANELTSAFTIPLKIEVRGRLHIVDFDSTIGPKKETHKNLEDGEKINKRLKPGDAFDFTIKVENTFSDEEDIDINNIVMIVIVSGIDDGEDLEEESDEFDLNPDESYSETFKFKTPLEVEEGEYEVQVDIEGEDDDGIDRKISWTLTIEVEKESHDIKIKNAVLSPSKIICGGTSMLSTTIYNFGRNEEDEVKLVIKSSALGINIEEFPIELENDLLEEESKWSKSYTIPVSRNQATGNYPIEMWLYFDEDNLDDYRKLELNVEGCEEEKEEEPVIVCGNNKIETGEECDDGNKISNDGCSSLCTIEETEEEEEKEQITGSVITETQEEGIESWIVALVGVNILVLIIIAVSIFLMFRNKGGEEILEE